MIRNFLFHRVSPQRDALWDPMDVSLFEKCLRYISRHYEIVQLENIQTLPDYKTARNKYATIVFDDGYKDNIEYAAPLLEKYKCPASFYIVTDCIDKNIPTWTHIIEHLFQFTEKLKIELQFDFLPENLKTRGFSSREERIAYVPRLRPFIKTTSHTNRNLFMQEIQRTFDDIALPEIMMNAADIRQLHNAGYSIGSHTVTHCMLGTMDDNTEIMHELKHSGERIQEMTGVFPQTISYPVGSYNEKIMRMSREAGYKAGLAVKQDVYNPARDGMFEIPRIELYNESWFKTRMRITHTLERIKKTIGYR